MGSAGAVCDCGCGWSCVVIGERDCTACSQLLLIKYISAARHPVGHSHSMFTIPCHAPLYVCRVRAHLRDPRHGQAAAQAGLTANLYSAHVKTRGYLGAYVGIPPWGLSHAICVHGIPRRGGHTPGCGGPVMGPHDGCGPTRAGRGTMRASVLYLPGSDSDLVGSM